MSLSIGIVGLANVGKSTLFNALLRESAAEVSNYPFCTIEPNVGIVKVPDSRLNQLQKILKLPKKIPAPIKFIDIAGLVKGAHKGAGLGNQFLANIRETDAIIIVLRAFSDPNIASPLNSIQPEEEYGTVKTELILKDLETVEKKLLSLAKDIKAGDKLAREQLDILRRVKKFLNDNQLAQQVSLDQDELAIIKDLNLLTLKPILAVLNCDEKDLTKSCLPAGRPPFISHLPEERQIEISVKIEAELAELNQPDQKEYLATLGLTEPGLNRLIRASFHLLNLISFYTFTRELVQAWPAPARISAQNAAGLIHSDFAKKFITAEAVDFSDLISAGSWEKAKSSGLVKEVGKNGQITDGQIVFFKHGK